MNRVIYNGIKQSVNKWNSIYPYAALIPQLPRRNYGGNNNNNSNSNTKTQVLLASIATVAGITIWKAVQAENKDVSDKASEVQVNLPTFSATEVSKHDSKQTRIWCSYKAGVYDITDFVDKHPGGDKILMAAGGALEPFWLLYAVHQTDQVLNLLETFRIGNLDASDQGQAAIDMADPYSSDPKRHPALKPASVKPYNAEPPSSILVDCYLTPNDLFYVRNHLPVPVVDVEKFELEVEAEGCQKMARSFKLEELKEKFEKHTVTAAIQCAGNRRSEMIAIKPIKGLSWGAAAMGNAEWTGVRLRDVLKSIGIDETNKNKFKHIQFEGLDLDPAGLPYGASILYDKAMDPDVLLAYEMNGQPLSPDHGYPLRVIIPGIVGARNVKWVSRIIASKNESDSHWQQNDYKGFPPETDWDTVDFKSAPAIQELPVQSAICDPPDNSQVKRNKNGTVKVRGYAWSGGGRGIVRVDVSSDGGCHWHTAQLVPADVKVQRAWAWTLWTAEIPVDCTCGGMVEICCRAVDSSYNVQPERVEPIWNLRGVLNNAWHRVKVNVV